jgi:arylsulfatase A-like enzyme
MRDADAARFQRGVHRRRRGARIGAAAIGCALVVCLAVGCRGGVASSTTAASYNCEDCNLVLISIDTLRADHLSGYGYPRPTSPTIDEFARRSVTFTQAVNTGGATLPVHMSMMTSLPPTVHGIWPGRGARLAAARTTLAEELRARGYATAAFTDGGWVLAKFGFGDGFDVFNEKAGGFRSIVPRAVKWLDQHREERFFLFLHSYDVHSDYERLPYDAPPPYRDRFVGDYSGPFWGCMRGACASRLLSSLNADFDTGRRKPADVFAKRDVDYLVSLYDGGIAYADQQVGRILEKLRSLGVAEKTIVVVTSDHGEEFLEHGRLLHERNYEETARVPMIVHLPGLEAKRRRVDELVSTLDLMPTVLAALGMTPNADVRGRNLLPFLDGVGQSPPVLIAALREDKLRETAWSLVVRGGAPQELYDLGRDPGERANVLAAHPDVAKRMGDSFGRLRAAELELKRALGDAPPPQEGLDESETEKLRALGYLN